MAVYELKNDVIAIAVDSHGAELKSLKKLDSGIEYMWCGDAKYPYDFVLKLGYSLKENQVKVMWRVENNASEMMPFSIGGHPAFNCPIDEGRGQTDYFLDFGDVDEIVSTRIGEGGLVSGCMDVYSLNDGKLAITDNLFDHDALIIEENQTQEVALCKKDGTPYLKVIMEAPLFGVWSPPGKQAPFVCIEPWYGRCDSEYFDGTLEEREWGNEVEPGAVWEAAYVIEV